MKTALRQIQNRFTRCKWFVEGDIKSFFDNIDHDIMIAILSKRINDDRFLRLIRKFLNAGYMEANQMHNTYSGTPQGGIISPILSNIYLDQIDKYMLDYKKNFDIGAKRAANKEYQKLAWKRHRLSVKADKYTDKTERAEILAQIKELDIQKLRIPCRNPMDGTKVRNFSRHIQLEVPTKLIRKKLLSLGTMKIDLSTGIEIWKPVHRGKFTGREDLSILDQYNGEVRGFCNYYSIANNHSKLHKFRYIMEYSMYKTFACKYRTTKAKIIEKYRINKDFGIRYKSKNEAEKVWIFWKDSLAHDPYPRRAEVDIIQKPKGILKMKKPILAMCMK